MDFFASTRALEWLSNKKNERYQNNNEEISPSPAFINPNKFTIFSLGGIVSFVIGIVIGVVAAYLSWSCNSALQYNIALKIFFALMAYIFGLFYIILYIIMRYDTCTYIKRGY